MAKMGARVRGQKGQSASGTEEMERHEETSTVSIPKCDGVGDCCMNHTVVLDPADLQRILNNKDVQDTHGISLTTDLYQGDRALLHYWVDPKSGVPMCVVRKDQQEDGNEQCAFLTKEGGTVRCLLGDDKPTACAVNPVRRVASKDMLGNMEGWRYIVNDNPCQICKKCDENDMREVQVEDHLESSGMKERYALNDLYHGFAGWLVANVKAQDMQQIATMLLFDFDSFSTGVGGMTREEAAGMRPASPESAILSARKIVEGIINPESMMEEVQHESGDDIGESGEQQPVGNGK